jgi:hypothetical protein
MRAHADAYRPGAPPQTTSNPIAMSAQTNAVTQLTDGRRSEIKLAHMDGPSSIYSSYEHRAKQSVVVLLFSF